MNTTKGSPLGTNRNTAIIVGGLYIIGTVAGLLSAFFYGSILNGTDYLIKVAANENHIIIGALFVLTMAFALAMVSVMMYPIFKRYNEALALGYVVFRGALETLSYIALVISRLLLILVSREYVAAGTPQDSYYQILGDITLKSHVAINPILIFCFSLGALMLYYLFYRSQLIPRWISVWGFIAILLHLATGFLMIFNIISSMAPIIIVLNFPIFLQEMVMAVWLIVKGFNPDALAPKAALSTRDF